VALAHESKHEPAGQLLGQRADGAPAQKPKVRVGSSHWLHHVSEAQRDISYYLMPRYNWLRPHSYNGGLALARTEEKLNPLSGIS